MAVARRAAGTAVYSTGSTIVPTYPTNQVGDYILLVVGTSGSVTTPSGFTLVHSLSQVTGAKLYIYSRFVSTVLSGSLTITKSGNASAVLISYSGADAPVSVSGDENWNSTNTTSANAYTGSGNVSTFAVAVFAVAGTATMSNESASAGTWAWSEAVDYSNTISLKVVDGDYTTSGTAVVSFNGTLSASRTYNAQLVRIAPATVVAATGDVKYYNGSTFVAKPVKYWTGSAWVVKPLKRWNGSAWVVTNY